MLLRRRRSGRAAPRGLAADVAIDAVRTRDRHRDLTDRNAHYIAAAVVVMIVMIAMTLAAHDIRSTVISICIGIRSGGVRKHTGWCKGRGRTGGHRRRGPGCYCCRW